MEKCAMYARRAEAGIIQINLQVSEKEPLEATRNYIVAMAHAVAAPIPSNFSKRAKCALRSPM